MGRLEVAAGTGIGALAGGVIAIFVKDVLAQSVPANVAKALSHLSFKNATQGTWIAKAKVLAKTKTEQGDDRVTFGLEDRYGSEEYCDYDYTDVIVKIDVVGDTWYASVVAAGMDEIEVYKDGVLMGTINRDTAGLGFSGEL